MNTLRRIIPTAAFLICIVLIALLTVQNWSTQVSLTVGGTRWIGISLGAILLITSLLGSLAVFIRLGTLIQHLRQEVKQFELRREKAEVKAETSNDQIRALESKIQTLEKALEQALSSSHSRKDR